MKRPNKNSEYVEIPEADAFIADIDAVCKKHGVGIAHEDCGGGFELMPYDQADMENWFKQASWKV